jgi:hypothetical protein
MSRTSGRRTGSSGRDDPAHEDADFLMSGFDPGPGGPTTGAPGSSQPPQLPQPDLPRPPPPPSSQPPQLPQPDLPRPSPEPPPQTGERPCEYWAVYEVFWTRFDERVCPVCGPLHGREYRQGQGPHPPLHGNCRCYRAYNRRECIARQGPGGSTGNARF